MLHDDDALLKGVLLVDLLLKLVRDETVRVPEVPARVSSPFSWTIQARTANAPGVLLGVHAHGSVLEHGDAPREVGDHLGRKLALLGDGGGELARVLLDVLDVRLKLGTELLEVLNDGALDSASEVGVVVGDLAGFLTLRGRGRRRREEEEVSAMQATGNAMERGRTTP